MTTGPVYLHPLRFRAATEMRTFDRLPSAIRAAVREAPIELDARKVHDELPRRGEARVLMEIAALGRLR